MQNSLLIEYAITIEQKDIKRDKLVKLKIFELSFVDFSKKILRELKIPIKNIPQCEIVLKLQDNENLSLECIEDLQFFSNHLLNEKPDEILNLYVKCKIPLKNKESKKKNIQFDEFGTLLGEQEEFLLNQPADKIYSKETLGFYIYNKQVECSFCRFSNDQKEYIKKLGPFYGPFQDQKTKKQYFFHLMCAIWTPKIYLGNNNKMQNVISEIKRSNKIVCTICGIPGAGLGKKIIYHLGCLQKGCSKSYHYKCAIDNLESCQLDYQKFVLRCDQHAIPEDDEYICRICQVDENDRQIILCDGCDNGFHMYCVEENIDEVPSGEWLCKRCKEQ